MDLLLEWSGVLCDDGELALALAVEATEHFPGRAAGAGSRPSPAALRRELEAAPLASVCARHCPAASAAAIEAWLAARYAECLPQLRLFAGVAACVEEWAARHRLLALSELAAPALEAAAAHFGLRGAFAVRRGGFGAGGSGSEAAARGVAGRDAPSPVEVGAAQLRELLARHGGHAHQALLAAGTARALAAGRAAGVQTAACTWGSGDAEGGRAAPADHAFRSLGEMAAHLREEAELERDRAPIATVGGLAFDGQGRCLLIRTAKWSGLWGTPGGKLRYREPMAAGFTREVREETGLEVADVRFALAQDSIDHPQFFRPRHFVLLNFVGRVAGGAVRLNYEADECAWVSLREARQLELNEPTRVLVEHVAAHPELLAWEGG